MRISSRHYRCNNSNSNALASATSVFLSDKLFNTHIHSTATTTATTGTTATTTGTGTATVSYITRYNYTTLALGHRNTSINDVNAIINFNTNNTNIRLLSTRFKKPKRECPYTVLNVSKDATPQQIKLAYFKEAKKCHPDLNPNDMKAKEKFQQVAAAYEVLSDPIQKRHYDTFGFTETNTGTRSSSSSNHQQYSEASAEEIFSSVSQDVGVMREAFNDYMQDLRDEFAEAAACASRGEWAEVREILENNRGAAIGVLAILLPAVLFFRFPALIAGVIRLLLLSSQVAFAALVRTGNVTITAKWLWSRMIQLSKDRTLRKRRRKR